MYFKIEPIMGRAAKCTAVSIATLDNDQISHEEIGAICRESTGKSGDVRYLCRKKNRQNNRKYAFSTAQLVTLKRKNIRVGLSLVVTLSLFACFYCYSKRRHEAQKLRWFVFECTVRILDAATLSLRSYHIFFSFARTPCFPDRSPPSS